MLVEGGLGIFGEISAAFIIKAFLVLFLVFYGVFAMILYRQIQLMTKKLPTPLSPLLRFVGIIHIGVAATVLLMIIGTF